jgi:hypothetical protein
MSIIILSVIPYAECNYGIIRHNVVVLSAIAPSVIIMPIMLIVIILSETMLGKTKTPYQCIYIYLY